LASASTADSRVLSLEFVSKLGQHGDALLGMHRRDPHDDRDRDPDGDHEEPQHVAPDHGLSVHAMHTIVRTIRLAAIE